MTLLYGWKEIANHLERVSGHRRSRQALMRWALRKPDPLPVDRDPSNRPIADPDKLTAWLGRHQYTY